MNSARRFKGAWLRA